MTASGTGLRELVDAVYQRLRRKALVAKSLFGLTVLSYGGLAALIVGIFSIQAASILLGCALPLAALGLWLRGFFSLPGMTAAGRALDQKLESKNRVVSYLELSDPSVQERDRLWQEKQKLLEKQLVGLSAGVDAEAVVQARLTTGMRCILGTLPLVYALAFFTILRFYIASSESASAQVAVISHLLEEQPALPPALKEDLRTLASALNLHELTSEEVAQALAAAQAELANSRAEMGRGRGTVEIEQQKTQHSESRPTTSPSPQPSASPAPTPQAQDGQKENSKQSEKKEEKGPPKQGAQGDQGQTPSDDSKDQEQGGNQGEGEGQGAQGGSNQEKGKAGGEGQGAGQGSSSAAGQEGQGAGTGKDNAGKEDSDNAGQEQGQEGRQEAGAGQQEDQSGSKGEGLSKVEQALSSLEQEIAQKKSEEKKSSEPGKQPQDALGSGNAQGKEEAKEPKESEEKGQAKESSGEKEREPGAGKDKDAKSDAPGDESTDSQREVESKDLEGSAPSASKRQGALLKEDAKGSKGLQGEKGFEEVEMPGQGEKYDPRFLSDETDLNKGKQGANYKVQLKDVQLAKPEVVKERGEQPIPLEYKEILE